MPDYEEFYTSMTFPTSCWLLHHIMGKPTLSSSRILNQGPSKGPELLSSMAFGKFGVWHEPEEFLKRAQEAKHPIDPDSLQHQITKDAIVQVVGTCSTKLAKDSASNYKRRHRTGGWNLLDKAGQRSFANRFSC